MKVAVFGCLHGELDFIYKKISDYENKESTTIDLVIVCGDFQTIRNTNDFKCISIPPKYCQLGSFHQYYFGDKLAPKLTILIGGNHEASNYLQTLPYGGWVAPNMYYLGYCSVVNFGSIRIGGISGIFKYQDAKLGHFECLPYNPESLRSIYHMREAEIYKLLQLPLKKNHVLDVFISHDWPINIHQCATKRDVDRLLYHKPHFRGEIEQSRLGNPLLQPLVHHLRPKYWFAAHLHAGFRAIVTYSNPEQGTESVQTEFQALDKIIPKRQFLRIVDIPSEDSSPKLSYDPEWLVILKKTDNLWIDSQDRLNNIDIYKCSNQIEITENDLQEVKNLFNDNFIIPENFETCKPVLSKSEDLDPERQENFVNPQTTSFCSKLGVWDINEMFVKKKGIEVKNPDEIDLSESDEDQQEETSKRIKSDVFFIDTKGTLA